MKGSCHGDSRKISYVVEEEKRLVVERVDAEKGFGFVRERRRGIDLEA